MFQLDTCSDAPLEVHCIVNGPIQTNTYLAVSKGEAVVIDPAYEGEKLAYKIAELCPNAHVVAMVCTHNHGDHLGGVAGLRRALGKAVPFYISEVDAATIPQAVEHLKEAFNIPCEEPPAPDFTLNEGDELHFGAHKLQAIATPGHTEGGMVFFCAASSGNVAFVGDTLFPSGCGRTDLPGGSEKKILLSLGKIGHELPEGTLCLTGHGDTTTIDIERENNLFMRRGLRRYRKALQEASAVAPSEC